MQGIEYEVRDVESIPMHDSKRGIYEVMLDGELVEIPAVLFKKIFREKDFTKIFGIKMGDLPEQIQNSYKDMRLGIKMWINSGYSLENIKQMIGSYYGYSQMPEPIKAAMNDVIEKIYKEETKDRGE